MKFVLPKIFKTFSAIFFYVFPYGPWKKSTKIFWSVLRKPTKSSVKVVLFEICELQTPQEQNWGKTWQMCWTFQRLFKGLFTDKVSGYQL